MRPELDQYLKCVDEDPMKSNSRWRRVWAGMGTKWGQRPHNQVRFATDFEYDYYLGHLIIKICAYIYIICDLWWSCSCKMLLSNGAHKEVISFPLIPPNAWWDELIYLKIWLVLLWPLVLINEVRLVDHLDIISDERNLNAILSTVSRCILLLF